VPSVALGWLLTVVTNPAGISGAVLLPFQVSVLGAPSPSVTSSQLAVQRGRDPGRAVPLLEAGPDGRLSMVLIAGDVARCDRRSLGQGRLGRL
jgi:hypothetical protein